MSKVISLSEWKGAKENKAPKITVNKEIELLTDAEVREVLKFLIDRMNDHTGLIVSLKNTVVEIAAIFKSMNELVDEHNKLKGNVDQLSEMFKTMISNDKITAQSISTIYKHLGIK